jgi:hypothetical protein
MLSELPSRAEQTDTDLIAQTFNFAYSIQISQYEQTSYPSFLPAGKRADEIARWLALPPLSHH